MLHVLCTCTLYTGKTRRATKKGRPLAGAGRQCGNLGYFEAGGEAGFAVEAAGVAGFEAFFEAFLWLFLVTVVGTVLEPFCGAWAALPAGADCANIAAAVSIEVRIMRLIFFFLLYGVLFLSPTNP
jgi:hypothetical protein